MPGGRSASAPRSLAAKSSRQRLAPAAVSEEWAEF